MFVAASQTPAGSAKAEEQQDGRLGHDLMRTGHGLRPKMSPMAVVIVFPKYRLRR